MKRFMTFARPSSEKGRSPGYDAPEVRHSRMFLAGIQVKFESDPDESIRGWQFCRVSIQFRRRV